MVLLFNAKNTGRKANHASNQRPDREKERASNIAEDKHRSISLRITFRNISCIFCLNRTGRDRYALL